MASPLLGEFVGTFILILLGNGVVGAGAFLGAVVVGVHYGPHWALTTDKDLKLGSFCTIPAIRHVGSNLASEVIGTFVLTLVAAAIFSGRVASGGPIAGGVGPVLVGCLVWGIGLSLGGTTGYGVFHDNAASAGMNGLRISVFAGTESYGIYNQATSGTRVVDIGNSVITATTATVRNDDEFVTRIGASQLAGGAVQGGGIIKCAGVYDEQFDFFAGPACP